MKLLKILIYFIGLCDLMYTEGASSISGNPGNINIHENNDAVVPLWTITSTTCSIIYQCTISCSTDCSYCGTSIFGVCVDYVTQYCHKTCYQQCNADVACDTCDLSDDGGQFQMSGFAVQKQACSTPGCGPSCSATGCTNAGTVYSGTVQCRRESYNSATIYNNGAVTTTFTMTSTQNAAPTFYFSAGSLITVDYTTHVKDQQINTIVVTDTDAYIDSDTYTIVYSGIHDPSFIHGNPLFDMPAQGDIRIIADLTTEFDYVYYMGFTVYDDRRRDSSTGTLTISLNACFQTPNCTGNTTTFYDTFGTYTGHGGASNTIFTPSSPNPSGHFLNFHTAWHELQWTFVWLGESHNNIAINYYTGEIYATGNISIFPAYPSKTFSLRVTVGNSESCYSTTCDFSITVIFTNWNLTWVNLPSTKTISEDNDNTLLVITILIFDYNIYTQDNVTCTNDSLVPNEQNLFELRNVDNGEGTHSYNSYEIWRLACDEPGCGYKYSSHGAYLCPQDKGCLNYDLRDNYVMTITCRDAYGAVITSTVTIRIIENEAPTYLNLPLTITIYIAQVSMHDTIFSILYSDNENENIIVEHTFAPDLGWYSGDTGGNYYNNLVNITTNTDLTNHTASNATQTITMCAHERRNEICAVLTLELRSNCGEVPTCQDQTVNVTNEFTVSSKLFDVIVTSGHTGCTYSFLSENAEYFNIDTNTGEVTSAKALDAAVSGTTYTLVAFVYHSASCSYGSCTYTVFVSAVNYAISIDNLPASVSVAEAITAETTLLRLQTSDNNQNDGVTCNVMDISPVPAVSSPPLVTVKETFLQSEVYDIVLRENPSFTSATTMYTVTIECDDEKDTTSTGTLTINVQVNQAPMITNLNAAATKDPFTLATGNEVFVVNATDAENDEITFDCYVANTFVPLECSSQQPNYVIMRRSVDYITENNAVYEITVCVGDALHVNDSCGTLSVTFTSSVNIPTVNNLPASKSIAENLAIGTTVYQLMVTDPDTGDDHTFLLIDASPPGTLALFSIAQSTGIVSTNTVFDYESAEAVYTLTFTVKDQNVESTDSWDLNVTISNVNEAPTLNAAATNITFAENTASGTTLTAADFSCTDPDGGDTLSYSISGAHAGYFRISTTDGVLELNTVWDLENAAYTTSTTLTVTCTDTGSLSSTLNLVIEVTAVNEFNPTLTSSFPLGATPSITSSTALTSVFLIITATDSDIFDDGSFTFEIMQPDNSGAGTRASSYFFLQYISSSRANLKLSKSVDLSNNATFPMTIKVSDGESPELFSTVAITVYYIASEQTVVGKTSKCLTCTSNGKILVAALCIEGVIVAVVVAHLILNFACRRNNVRRLPRSNRPSISTVTSRQLRSLGPRSAAGAGGASMTANNANSRQIEESDISDSSVASSDSDTDDSMPNSPRPSTNVSEVGRRGFSMQNSGLPPARYASQVPRVMGAERPRPGGNPFSNPRFFQSNYV